MNDTGGPHNYTIIRLCILVEFVGIIRAKIYSPVASSYKESFLKGFRNRKKRKYSYLCNSLNQKREKKKEM